MQSEPSYNGQVYVMGLVPVLKVLTKDSTGTTYTAPSNKATYVVLDSNGVLLPEKNIEYHEKLKC